ncbi:hypothetical protein QTP86_011911 [Hemibagrus guttatus]|nr:hypothetical protein QTP86_011911 [Hemibagrus guttatus]
MDCNVLEDWLDTWELNHSGSSVLSAVQMEFHEDLKLHVSVPEPVEVIYKSSGSADEVICRVNNLSLQCKDEYRDRTSLTYPEITLRHVEPRDSGSYTIRDTENEQDIQIYAVSVEEGVKEKMSEAEEKIYQLELHMTSEDVVEVSGFCMCMRAELFWSRLHSDKDQIMTDNIEILWKVEEVMMSLQKVRDGVKREQDPDSMILKAKPSLLTSSSNRKQFHVSA